MLIHINNNTTPANTLGVKLKNDTSAGHTDEAALYFVAPFIGARTL